MTSHDYSTALIADSCDEGILLFGEDVDLHHFVEASA